MRILRCLLVLLATGIVALANDISRNPSITLGDETLFLASVESSPDIVLNEYIRKTENFENWKVLFAVRYVRSAGSVDEVVRRWKAYVAQVKSPGKKIQEEEGSVPTDRRFMLAIRPPGDAYLENDQMRFIPGPDGKGVIYYQAAVRVNPRDATETMSGLRKLVDFAGALKSLSVQPLEKLPDSTSRLTPGN
jgi:hypothetical protein